ncbi:CBS domain-containing protein [Clostridium botulinum]|nr:CBS domain-containing protein [Clostridium botulinum]NFS95615.1 CBS domain-containing protein [Clostridium botulinum]
MKFDIEKLIILENSTIKTALMKIDETGQGIVLVTDNRNKLLGTITDGDIRRALLAGKCLESPICNVVHNSPVCANVHMSKEEIKDLFIKKAIKQIPVIDDENKVIDIISIHDILLPEGNENPVIIMAGGLGTRLKELTKEVPKPMLKVGQYPILQHIINNFKQYGYNKIFISVNYKSEIIENYFQNGYAHGVKIDYLKEQKRMGTAGGIKLASESLNTPFFVINGDIFTSLNVDNMMKFHKQNNFDITVGIRKHMFQIPYGVVEIENSYIIELKEKPTIDYFINAGVYCLNPSVLRYIPENKYFEITDLINICIENDLKVGSYEINEYWMDIGHLEDYNKVNQDIDDLV